MVLLCTASNWGHLTFRTPPSIGLHQHKLKLSLRLRSQSVLVDKAGTNFGGSTTLSERRLNAKRNVGMRQARRTPKLWFRFGFL